MKSILMSIQPHWGFLIIAKGKGWDLEKYGLHEKTVEVRKGIPTSPDWDKKVALYFSKDKKSLARVPEEYRGDVAKLCGKVVGEFVCDKIYDMFPFGMGIGVELNGKLVSSEEFCRMTCLTEQEICDYVGIKDGYGLHISDLKIYDKPKELSEFWTIKCNNRRISCGECDYKPNCIKDITRLPQSWRYVEEL